MEFTEVESYEQLSRNAANIISAQIIMKPNSVIGLATGSTPIGTYNQLIERNRKGDLDFSKVTTVNLDEYVGLSESNTQSYRYFMNTHLFDFVNINKDNTFVPNGKAADLKKECELYDRKIKELGGVDLQLLGIGHDGHIGFNEPDREFVKSTHEVVLQDSTIKANARFFESEAEVPKTALTMGMLSIMQAKKILMIICGEDKKEIMEKAFYGPITPAVPASILQLHPNITVIYTKERY